VDKTIRDGVCPRCGSTVIKTERASIAKRSTVSFHAHNFDIFVCAKCRYTEFYYDKETLNW
jgi:predicted nucleic-acid-binding Zn-ribbon protein